MILADTSVWVEHFRRGEPELARCLEDQLILMHAVVLGELACGNLQKRARTLADLAALPRCLEASEGEVRELIEARRLYGRGIGWLDAQLLAGALLSRCALWTLDARLGRVAKELGVAGRTTG